MSRSDLTIRAEIADCRRRRTLIAADLERISTLAHLVTRLPDSVLRHRERLSEQWASLNRFEKHLIAELVEVLSPRLEDVFQQHRDRLMREDEAQRQLRQVQPKPKRASAKRAPKLAPVELRKLPPDSRPEVSHARRWTMSLQDDRSLPLPIVSLADAIPSDAHILNREANYRAAAMLRWAPWERRLRGSRRYEGFPSRQREHCL